MIKNWQAERCRWPGMITIKIGSSALISHFENICVFEYIFYIKKISKSTAIMSIHIRLNICIAYKCDRCINTGEPAAVFCLSLQIKAVELSRPEGRWTLPAGNRCRGFAFYWSLGGSWSAVIGHLSLVIGERVKDEKTEDRREMTEERDGT